MPEMTLAELNEQYPDHEALPKGRTKNGVYPCIGCGRYVSKQQKYLNWCSDCSEDSDDWR